MCCKEKQSSNLKQNTKKRKIGKQLARSDAHVHNFIEQNYLTVERSIPYINYQWEVAIKNDFGKKTAENPKIEKLLEKSQKITKKSRDMCSV